MYTFRELYMKPTLPLICEFMRTSCLVNWEQLKAWAQMAKEERVPLGEDPRPII